MRLVSVTIENFRSITAARSIQIAQVTTLIGPNNEGKSNILRAIAIALNVLVRSRENVPLRPRSPRSSAHFRRMRQMHQYSWEVDYPLKQQSSRGPKNSHITLEFKLDDAEIEAFRDDIGSKLNGTLPMAFTFGEGDIDIKIVKQGPGQKTLNAKVRAVAKFIADRIDIQYIPAVRTAEAAGSIVDRLVDVELAKIEDDPKYQQAMADIAVLQEPILQQLSENIASTMRDFIPQLSGVKLKIDNEHRRLALRASEILIDDGVETLLQYKGDGVQSLAALAIMRHVSRDEHASKEVIVALEEPESHLHPGAIRQLYNVLHELSARHQVIMTTHNPLFANRSSIGSNIIVNRNRAVPARTVAEVRDVLGVRLDDNLVSAELILLVEGKEDKVALSGIMADRSTKLAEAMADSRLAIVSVDGAGNLASRARMYRDSLCKIHAIVDADAAGKSAVSKAQAQGVLELSDINMSACGGLEESELEDLYEPEIYGEVFRHELGIDTFLGSGEKPRKWSDRTRALLRRVGKPVDDVSLGLLKLKVAQAAADRGWAALMPGRAWPVDSAISSLVAKLESR